MKKIYFIVLIIVLGLNSLFALGNTAMENDSVSLGAGYANDVYYSFESGEILSVERQNWDIAFYTSPWSAGIITNGGNGTELYLYPFSDTSAWNSIDTTGLSTWPVLFNSTDDWENGAFNRHATGHPDYGWGVYNSITHDVVGDSLYLLKLSDGNLKKLWIQKKVSMQNTWYFKYADLDGGNEVSEVLSFNDYTDKNFVYYSIQTGESLDREPASVTWDILFTKYMGINNDQPYPVTGVLNNVDVPANKFMEVGPDFEDWLAAPMDSTKSSIGYDWKYFDMTQFTYIMEDSLTYFVRNKDKNVYKLVFSAFDYTIGKVVFEKSMVYTSAISESKPETLFSVYPNPASDFINIGFMEKSGWEGISIADINGKTIYQAKVSGKNIKIPISKYPAGIYFVSLKSANSFQVRKLIIR
ncbi:MAG: T9SS type A sorting domain-containing protein [Chlorobi bacterium]|nr:T9SS type A sorting domain-containing protein [Chlorobiota bacterium]